jgi:hypothetical protein
MMQTNTIQAQVHHTPTTLYTNLSPPILFEATYLYHPLATTILHHLSLQQRKADRSLLVY